MPADRLLGTLLRSLQTYADQEDTPRLLGTASSLLTTLNNPLNVSLLTSQLLSAPAIWAEPRGLRTSVQCLSVFHSAAQALVRHEKALKEHSADREFSDLQLERTLPKDDWIRAVINGADKHSPRWRHLLTLGGLLLGLGSQEDEFISSSLRSTIEQALITAVNLALEETPLDDGLAQQSITLVLNHCFSGIADHERAQLNYDALLPVLLRSALHSSEGLRSAYFLGVIDPDVQQVAKSQFRWSEQSATFQETQRMLASPLLSALGPLSRLIAHTVEHVRESQLVVAAVDDIQSFSSTLNMQWRQNKFSEIDSSEEALFLDRDTLEKTLPQLWKLLRSAMFAMVIILRSAIGRILADPALASDEAPVLATRALQTLRSLYFISTRMNAASFSQYTFVYLTAMDILARYPVQTAAFVSSITSQEISTIPAHPLDRCLDLFFLNTAEHFTLVLPMSVNGELLVAAASPYLASGGNNNLLHIFEAAHSVMLAVFSAPQNAELTVKHLPFYVETLFNVFPHNITARQFRLAFKTLLRLTSPPSILSMSQPMMPAILLELLHDRAKTASTTPLPAQQAGPSMSGEQEPPLSEQAVLTLTIIDTLTEIHTDLLAEWLPLVALMANGIADEISREHCKSHFWHILVDGEMDPDRSRVCHSWWSTGGGRELLIFGPVEEGLDGTVAMSGALPTEQPDSKL